MSVIKFVAKDGTPCVRLRFITSVTLTEQQYKVFSVKARRTRKELPQTNRKTATDWLKVGAIDGVYNKLAELAREEEEARELDRLAALAQELKGL